MENLITFLEDKITDKMSVESQKAWLPGGSWLYGRKSGADGRLPGRGSGIFTKA